MLRFDQSHFVTVPRHLLLLMILMLACTGNIAFATGLGPLAHKEGGFGPLHTWPIIPIAMMLMPDERVFAYGTTPSGVQDAKMHYAIWDPSLGVGSDAFDTLPNTTSTDIFCAAQAVIPRSTASETMRISTLTSLIRLQIHWHARPAAWLLNVGMQQRSRWPMESMQW